MCLFCNDIFIDLYRTHVNYGKEPVKGPEEYFGFETRGDVSLDVNYALPGFADLLKKYIEINDDNAVGEYIRTAYRSSL